MEDINTKIHDILTRGVGECIDPDGSFREKLTQKAKGEYDEDVIIKFGVDPTRPDIHLGHAVVFRKLREFQNLGCKVVFLIGDFTAQIGDPSGKSKVRPEIQQKEIEENMATFLDQVGKILSIEKTTFSWIRNSDWFLGITDIAVDEDVSYTDQNNNTAVLPANSFPAKAVAYERSRMQTKDLHKKETHSVTFRTFLSVLRHITHGQLVQRDMFDDRIKAGKELYMHEMMYPVLQGIDSSILHKIYGSCDLEIGGTDQSFNMLTGRQVMKMEGLPEQAVLSIEVLEGTDGKEKMSKSLDNYIGITDAPNDMFGKVMSIPDTLIVRYYTLATFTPLSEIEEIQTKLEKGNENPRDLKINLAHQVVAIYHGEKAAKQAEENFANTFQHSGIPEDVQEVTISKEVSVSDALVKEGIVSSKSDFRRTVEQGGIKNAETGETIEDYDISISEPTILKIGKHRFVKVNPS